MDTRNVLFKKTEIDMRDGVVRIGGGASLVVERSRRYPWAVSIRIAHPSCIFGPNNLRETAAFFNDLADYLDTQR